MIQAVSVPSPGQSSGGCGGHSPGTLRDEHRGKGRREHLHRYRRAERRGCPLLTAGSAERCSLRSCTAPPRFTGRACRDSLPTDVTRGVPAGPRRVPSPGWGAAEPRPLPQHRAQSRAARAAPAETPNTPGLEPGLLLLLHRVRACPGSPSAQLAWPCLLRCGVVLEHFGLSHSHLPVQIRGRFSNPQNQ